MAVLSDKGLTCSNSLCRQRDFLPFTCNKCGKVFCLDHYLPDGHSCPMKNAGDRRVYICPTCLEVVGLQDLETEQEAAGRHRPHCRPELRGQREQLRKGKHCPVKGCKEVRREKLWACLSKRLDSSFRCMMLLLIEEDQGDAAQGTRLTPISSIKCPHCQADVCIRHRLKEDHNCEALASSKNERKRNSLLRQLSSSASKGIKMKWHSDSSNNSDYIPRTNGQTNESVNYPQPSCIRAAAMSTSSSPVGSSPSEGCECDVYACCRAAGAQKDRKGKKGGMCAIM